MEVKRNTPLTIANKYPEVFYKLYHQLKHFNLDVKKFFLTDSEIEFVFVANGRPTLNYNELEVLQNIINPEIKHHDSIRVIGFDHVYTLRARLL